MPRFKITVDTNLKGCQHVSYVDFDDKHWASITPEMREDALKEANDMAVWEFIEVWSEEVPAGEGESG